MKKNIYLILIICFALAVFSSCEKENNYSPKLTYDKFIIPGGMNIKSVDFISNNIGLVCGGSKNDSGSIYKTVDGGESWAMVFHSDSLSVNDVFYLNDSVVYACGDSLMLLKSVNGGNTWDLITLGNIPYQEYNVPYNSVYAHSENNICLVGGEHFNKGLWSETETGNYPWIHDSYDNQLNAICYVSEYVGFFGGYGILLVTEDGGNTFDNIDLSGNDFIDLEVDRNKTVYALSETGILYSTTDLGYNWTKEIDNNNAKFTDMSFGQNNSVICGKNGLLYTRKVSHFKWSKAEDLPKVNFNCSFVKDNDEIVIGSENGEIYIFNRKRTN